MEAIRHCVALLSDSQDLICRNLAVDLRQRNKRIHDDDQTRAIYVAPRLYLMKDESENLRFLLSTINSTSISSEFIYLTADLFIYLFIFYYYYFLK
jgi:hypothetical protein